MKILLFKIKTWFILRWKEIKSIFRDKKEIKMERQVRIVDFHKKHPTYTLFTRIFAVVFCLAFVAVGIVSCANTYKDVQEEISAKADEIDSSEYVAYSANDRFIIDLPSFPIRAYAISGEDIDGDLFFVEYLYSFSVVFDVSHFEIYEYVVKDPSVSFTVFDSNVDIEQLGYFWVGDADIWYNDTGIYELAGIDILDSDDIPFTGSFGLLDYYEFVTHVSTRQIRLSFYDVYSNHIDYYFDIIDTEYFELDRLFYFSYDNRDYSNSIYTSGFDVGYSDGLSDGRADGYLDGQRDGYDLGYQDGYDYGYFTGISTSLEDVTPWDVIVSGVNSFFGLSFLGNSVTVGMILSIGFGALLLGFAIKIFLGG